MSDPGDDDFYDLDFTRPGAIPPREEPKVAVPSRSSVPARLEEVARLYAEGHTAGACSLLEGALHHENFGDARPLAWCMMFDLYQKLGRRQAFEALAIGYAGKFEQSPPTWTASVDAPAVGTDGLATVTLSGVLGANAVQPLGRLREMAGKVPGVRLDLGKVADADDTGCGALLQTLRVFKQLKKSCELVGVEQVAATLATKTVMGERAHESTWLLLLELYQNLNNPNAFEDAAVGYAVTFEKSPPSFEAPRAQARAPAAAVAPKPAAPQREGFALAGEMQGGDRSQFTPLVAYAASNDPVVIDTGGLERMDSACAEEFAKVLAELKSAGKTLRLRSGKCLVVALWRTLGIDRVADIETRKL